LFGEALGRGIAPGRRDCFLERYLADLLEEYSGGAAASPRALRGDENAGIVLREIMLLLRSELDHAPAFRGIAKGGEDLSSHAEVWVVHVSVFCGFGKSQCQAAKIVGGHAEPSTDGTCVR